MCDVTPNRACVRLVASGFLALVACPSFCPSTRGEPDKPGDLERMKGVWVVKSYEEAGISVSS